MEQAEAGRDAGLSAMERDRMFSMRSDVLHLILLPTEKCNFRCTYCYEDFSVGRMKPEIIQGVKRMIDNRLSDLNRLKVSWFGGEPLLAINAVEDISGHIMAASRTSSLDYTADMTTNGYLLDKAMLGRLTPVGVRRFQISLDGPEQLHDRTRVRADGRGSFKRLWKNLLSIRDGEAPVSVLLRVHVTPDNLSAMPEFLRRLREVFLSDERFSVYLKPVARLGGPNDATMETLDKRNRAQVLSHLNTIIYGAREGSPSSEDHACYAARPNSLVIRANGRLGKCTVSLTDPANDLGRLLPDGTLEVRNDRLHPWLRGWETGDMHALRCPADGFTLREPKLLQIGSKPVGRDS
ncbi:radical SAM protein [Streptomyces eurythermus]|uniref:radical SAM protein n=1 Tax=Streptomyces eurythermus TaxID=42237 RepID=UPI0036FFB9C2